MLGHGTDPVVRFVARRSHRFAIAIACTCGLWLAASPAQAQIEVRIDTPSLTLTPTAADYNQDYVDALGASGIQLRVRNQFIPGMHLFVRCSDAAPRIALNDLLVRTPTAPGIGGTTMSTFTPITATNQSLWSSTVSLPGFSTQVVCEVRVRNLMFYDDSPAAGTTGYQNTLTFTVVSP